MQIDQPPIVVSKISQADRWVQLPVEASESCIRPIDLPLEPRTLDWITAVDTAAVRLNEGFGLQYPMNDPVLIGLAQELAALLCAYGMVAEEIDGRQPHNSLSSSSW